ncbi:MAG: UbiX family flavin prenyltransferase [Bacteroidales bacterium]|nr:UbiX family flavin prenyltransferase [Bacteroidales bacterium]
MNTQIIIAVTGASGSIYAQKFINDVLIFSDYSISLIFSETAKKVWEYELTTPIPSVSERIKIFSNDDFFAAPASGSADYSYMVIIPCSMGTLGRIAHGISIDLIGRAADVMLKERQKLILVPRELPYNLIHLRNMTQITEAGGIIIPASPSFYNHPQKIEQLIETVTDRILPLININKPTFRWGNK